MRRLVLLGLLAAGCQLKEGAGADDAGAMAARHDAARIASNGEEEPSGEESDGGTPGDGSSQAQDAIDASPKLPRCGAYLVGYGVRSADGKVGERRGAPTCVARIEPYALRTESTSVGTCDGDSGGPLYVQNTNIIIGLLSGSAARATEGYCEAGALTYHVSLRHASAFIMQVLSGNPEAK